ncbi:MAG TPA: hypothetical protein VGE07_21670, partial [Herpetosiphonaceae bacterium]
LLSGFMLMGLAAGAASLASAQTPPPICLTATPAAWKTVPLSARQTGSFAVEADLTPPASATSGAFAVASGAPASGAWSGLAAIILFDDASGTIKARDGAAYVDAPAPLHYQAGVSYRLRMEIDVAAKTYAASVTPAGGGKIVIGSALRFRETQATVSGLDQMVLAAGTGSAVTGCNFSQPIANQPPGDGFGTAKVFQTAAQGREWHMNPSDPAADPQVRISSGELGWDSAAAGWKIAPEDGKIRFNVLTPKTSAGVFTAAPWLNIEMTGYFRVADVDDRNDELTLYARGGQHTDAKPCEGTAYKGSAEFLGGVSVQKEVFHGKSGAGYTDNPAKRGVGKPWGGFLGLGRWVGVKVAVFNTTAGGRPAVQTEIWLDETGANSWRRVSLAVDIQTGTVNGFPAGDWTTDDAVPGACGWNRGYVVRTGVTPGRESWATFRTDNAALLISRLAIREIDPLQRLIAP